MPPVASPVIAVSRRDLPGGALNRLPSDATVIRWSERRPPSAQELLGIASSAHGLLCMHTERIDAAFLAACPDLVVVSTLGVGYEHLDLDALAGAGVSAGNTPGVLEDATADMTWALILATARRLVEADHYVRQLAWTFPDLDLFVGPDLAGATLGIIGYGRIGKAVARRSVGFSMTVIHYDPTHPSDGTSQSVGLDELARRSDVISVHTPLTNETRHLINASFLEKMKSTAVLINTSRGDVVDQVALAAALEQHKIFGAGLDVQAIEPVPAGDPLLQLDNCVLLPHIGSASFGARKKMADLAVDNLLAALAGIAMPAPLLEAPGR